MQEPLPGQPEEGLTLRPTSRIEYDNKLVSTHTCSRENKIEPTNECKRTRINYEMINI
jgi:hypothetical protein